MHVLVLGQSSGRNRPGLTKGTREPCPPPGEEKAFFAKRIVHAVAGALLNERDVSRPDWKTASFGRGSARGCRVSADLLVQMAPQGPKGKLRNELLRWIPFPRRLFPTPPF